MRLSVEFEKKKNAASTVRPTVHKIVHRKWRFSKKKKTLNPQFEVALKRFCMPPGSLWMISLAQCERKTCVFRVEWGIMKICSLMTYRSNITTTFVTIHS